MHQFHKGVRIQVGRDFPLRLIVKLFKSLVHIRKKQLDESLELHRVYSVEISLQPAQELVGREHEMSSEGAFLVQIPHEVHEIAQVEEVAQGVLGERVAGEVGIAERLEDVQVLGGNVFSLTKDTSSVEKNDYLI
jgi:hypothetical protein